MFNPNKIPNIDLPSAEDYIDNPIIFGLLKRLPDELALFHINKVEEESMDDDAIVLYLRNVLEKREAATRVSEISDSTMAKQLEGRESEIFNSLETDIFLDTSNFLGAGMTAKVKSLTLETESGEQQVAVKYLITPTSKTLSARGEHDMIREVERMQTIEKLGEANNNIVENIRVPHPYFHHKNEHVQCYGMEFVDGVNLEEAIAGKWKDSAQKEKVKTALEEVTLENLFEQVDAFYTNMHTYCLHGDMKPANIMIGTDGTFFIIDFGQSILISEIPDKAQDQMYTLREDEIKFTKDAIRLFLGSLRE